MLTFLKPAGFDFFFDSCSLKQRQPILDSGRRSWACLRKESSWVCGSDACGATRSQSTTRVHDPRRDSRLNAWDAPCVSAHFWAYEYPRSSSGERHANRNPRVIHSMWTVVKKGKGVSNRPLARRRKSFSSGLPHGNVGVTTIMAYRRGRNRRWDRCREVLLPK